MDGCCFILQCLLLLYEVALASEFCYSSAEIGDIGAVKIVVLSCLSCVCAQWAVFYREVAVGISLVLGLCFLHRDDFVGESPPVVSFLWCLEYVDAVYYFVSYVWFIVT